MAYKGKALIALPEQLRLDLDDLNGFIGAGYKGRISAAADEIERLRSVIEANVDRLSDEEVRRILANETDD